MRVFCYLCFRFLNAPVVRQQSSVNCHDLQVVDENKKHPKSKGVLTPLPENRMAFLKVWIHFVWSTKDRQPILSNELRRKVFAHISENAERKEIHLDCINGVSDHVHALISLRADQAIARVAQLLKGESSFWINQQKLSALKFEWQDEYFAVSVGDTQVHDVREYIYNQEEHHRKKSFAEEYQEFMDKYGFDILHHSGVRG